MCRTIQEVDIIFQVKESKLLLNGWQYQGYEALESTKLDL